MSIVLFIVGALALIAGAGMAAYGIPINEFSFGNTLIMAGTTAIIGGLILIGLGAAVRQLREIAKTLAMRSASAQPGHALPASDVASEIPPASASVKMPPPSRAVPEPGVHEPPPLGPRLVPDRHQPPSRLSARPEPEIHEPPRPAPYLRGPHPTGAALQPPQSPESIISESPVTESSVTPRAETRGEPGAQSFAPVLRNPEAPPRPLEEKNPSPQPSVASPAPAAFGAPWRQHAPSVNSGENNFDAQGATEPNVADNDAPSTGGPNWVRRDSAARPAAAQAPASNQARSVEILKSGVVDGMAYTLYVDGSIEAELPQGPLRFASIDALRSHLEKN